jgi:enoyl-CoA hydratase/carnithine racemase
MTAEHSGAAGDGDGDTGPSEVGGEVVRVEVRRGVGLITLDRPERRNAFSGQMGRLLGAAYRRCDADDEVRAVVVTGTPPAFCAGADMTGGAKAFSSPAEEGFSAAGVDPPAWMVRKPVLAAINGHAVGIGLTLALQCDMRVVAEDAKLGIVQVRRGVIPDAFSHWTLARIAGLANAADVLLTGRLLSGREATGMGLANRCCPADEVLEVTVGLAEEIAAEVAPLSAAITKRLLWESLEGTRAQVGPLETELHRHVMGRPDAVEGVMAFLERRAPSWRLSVSRDFPEWPDPR